MEGGSLLPSIRVINPFRCQRSFMLGACQSSRWRWPSARPPSRFSHTPRTRMGPPRTLQQLFPRSTAMIIPHPSGYLR